VIFRFLPALLLASCAALPLQQRPPEPAGYQPHLQRISAISNFALAGRIAVLTETKGFSGSMRWHHQPDRDAVSFYSPLGTQIGQLEANATMATLTTSDQKTYQANDVEILTQQTLGWSLPMSGLHNWVLGRPNGSGAEILAWDEAGRIAHLTQDGWDIEYPAYKEVSGRQLPAKIVMKSRKLDLKLVIEDWQTDAEP
jgi:outer membrane lipoprotein LolB